jgi:hypothetical protein
VKSDPLLPDLQGEPWSLYFETVRLSASEFVERPPPEVFRFVATEHWKNHPTWDSSIFELQQTTPGPIGTLGCCQTGDDEVYGGPGHDVVFGSDLGDTNLLDGGPGNDLIQGFGPNDTAYGRSGMDEVFGFFGDDFLSGGKGSDVVGKSDDAGDDIMKGARARMRSTAALESTRSTAVSRGCLHQRRSGPEMPVDQSPGGGPTQAGPPQGRSPTV